MSYFTPVGRFRVIAFVEGVSYLVLLLIAMPMKYLGDDPAPVWWTGRIHGGLYVLYAFAGFQAMAARKWPAKEVARGFIASIIPGGTFVYDFVFLKQEHAAEYGSRKMDRGELP